MDSKNSIIDPISILKQYWGYESFRPLQQDVIEAVLRGEDTLVLMPTGGGKSIIYQVPTLSREGLCIVITPLIALMKDQVDRLNRQGIKAVAIHSGLSPRQIDIQLDNCAYDPKVKFLYIAPERIGSDILTSRVRKMNIRLIAVDEAHCISQWGYDFRPAYRHIADLRELCPEASLLALTASATEVVADDIMTNLKFDQKRIFRGNFSRPNLSYAVRKVEDKNGQLLRLLRSVEGSGIVYVRTREATEQVAEFLRSEGITATAYNAGLPHTERALRQEDWMHGKSRVMVATNAFGMGIDKPDVRFVVHYTMCDSLESYYQEAGRAGRDGKRSYALLMVAQEDKERVRRRFLSSFPPLEKVKEIYDQIGSYLQIAVGDGALGSYNFNIHDFCSRHHLYHGLVESAVELLEQNGYMTLTDELENPARIMFSVSRDDLYGIRCSREDLDPFIRTLLRLYNGVFTDFKRIDELEIAHWSGYTLDRVKEMLKRLWQLRIIRYIPSNRSPLIFYPVERLPIDDIYISPQTYKLRKELTEERFSSMLSYIENQEVCRSRLMEEYFGAESPSDCGVCDICLARKRNQKSQNALEQRVLLAVKESPLTIQQLATNLSTTPQNLSLAIESLIHQNKIEMSVDGIIGKIS